MDLFSRLNIFSWQVVSACMHAWRCLLLLMVSAWRKLARSSKSWFSIRITEVCKTTNLRDMVSTVYLA